MSWRHSGTGIAVMVSCIVLSQTPSEALGTHTVRLSWSADGLIQQLPALPAQGGLHLTVEGTEPIEDCHFSFTWVAAEESHRGLVRVGWRRDERPDERWLYATRDRDERGRPLNHRCKVEGWTGRGESPLRVFIPLQFERFPRGTSVWVLLTRLAVRVGGEWIPIQPDADAVVFAGEDSSGAPPMLASRCDPPRLVVGTRAEHVVYLDGYRLEAVSDVHLQRVGEGTPLWMSAAVEHVSPDRIRLSIPDPECNGTWEFVLVAHGGRSYATNVRITGVGSDDTVTDATGTPLRSANAPRSGDVQPGVLVVQFRDGVVRWPEEAGRDPLGLEELTMSPATRDLLEEVQVVALQHRAGTKTRETLWSRNTFHLQLPAGLDLSDVARALKENGNVVSADASRPADYLATPNDPYYNSEQWHLNPSLGPYHIKATAAWDRTVGSAEVRLAIVDTGLDYMHPELGGGTGPGYLVSGGWSFYNDDANFLEPPAPSVTHGTMVAGVAAAMTNNGVGVAGVAGGWGATQGCTLYGARGSTDVGQGYQYYLALALRGASELFAPDVINGSWGFYVLDSSLRAAVDEAYKGGALQVFGQGNGGSLDPLYPAACWPEVTLAVGGYLEDSLPYGHDLGHAIAVCAPADNITTIQKTTLDPPYRFDVSGTSLAAPQISGLAVLLLARAAEQPSAPPLAPEDVKWLIQRGAIDMGDQGYDSVWGWGRVDADSALRFLEDPWRLLHRSVAGGAVVDSVWDESFQFACDFDDLPLPWGEDFVFGYRYRVVCDVTYPPMEGAPLGPYVWGRGEPDGLGYSAAMPNYCTSYCRVVPGSETVSGCQLETYVYRLWTEPNAYYLGYYPAEPTEVVFQYSLLGVPSSGVGAPAPAAAVGAGQRLVISVEPNPIRGEARIRHSVVGRGASQVAIFDVEGRRVRRWSIEDGGSVSVWDRRDERGRVVPSGVYFVEVQSGGQRAVERAVVLR